MVEAGDVGNVSVENVVDVDSFEVRMGFKSILNDKPRGT